MRHPGTIRDERATASAFVVGMAITLLAVAGLVIDGGHALNARMKLADDTEQAARSGAQQVDEAVLRSTGDLRLDQGNARRAAATFIGRFNYSNAGIDVTEDEVTVRATDTVDTTMLNLIGIDHFEISAEATAEAVTQ